MPESPAPQLDDETTAALTLFNEYVAADRERARRDRRVKKAERAKDDAAAAVKKLEAKGSAEQKAAAETTYREAAEMWRRLRDGEEPEATPTAAPEPEASEPAETEQAETEQAEPEPATQRAEPETAEPEPEPDAPEAAETEPETAEPEPETPETAEPEPETAGDG